MANKLILLFFGIQTLFWAGTMVYMSWSSWLVGNEYTLKQEGFIAMCLLLAYFNYEAWRKAHNAPPRG